MTVTESKQAPAEDLRLKRVMGALHKYRRRHDALIEILHVVEEVYGFIPAELMRLIAKETKVAPSRIYGVVTFYHFFTLKPKGEHNCVVCTGTACHVRGSRDLLLEIEKVFGLKPGQTTPDGKLGVQSARCLGCCSLAPVMVVDDQIFAHVKPKDAEGMIRTKLGVGK